MAFTSIKFLYFFAIFLIIYALCPRKFRKYILLAGSLAYCFMSTISGTVILLSVTLVNYILGALVQASQGKGRRLMLATGVVCDVLVLLIFKITNSEPIGLSYYTFGCIAYLADIYRKTIQAEQSIGSFATYMTMFPKVLMGPITRYSELGPQLNRPKQNAKALQRGLELFILGLCMKVLVADKLYYLWRDMGTIGYDSLPTALAWLAIFGYSIYIYLDCHSYALMAIGIAKMLGYDLPQEFNFPYMAKSVGDFFRRWRMTLQRWFKDYVYIPLGGNRKGTVRTLLNILFIWLLTSIWHGWGWNFIFWGMSIGILIVLERLFLGKALDKLHILPHLYVLLVIPLTWCCFEITDLHELGIFFSRLFPMFSELPADQFLHVFYKYLKDFWPYLIAGVICCTPIPERIVKRHGRNIFVSLLLAALFWWAVYELQRIGSNTNPNKYLNF